MQNNHRMSPPLIPSVIEIPNSQMWADYSQRSSTEQVQMAKNTPVTQSCTLTVTLQSQTPSVSASETQRNQTPLATAGDSANAVASESQSMITQPVMPTIVINTPQTVRPYKGNTSWSSFRDNFNQIAMVNGWNTDAIKAQHLMISLEGSAAEILKDIDEQSPTLYQDIWRALSKRFGEVDEQRESMKRFEQRRQNDSETVVEFDQALRNLYRKAWPKSTAQQKEVALKRVLKMVCRIWICSNICVCMPFRIPMNKPFKRLADSLQPLTSPDQNDRSGLPLHHQPLFKTYQTHVGRTGWTK